MRREDLTVERLAAALLLPSGAALEAMTRQWAFVRAVLVLEGLARGQELTPLSLSEALHQAMCQSTEPTAPPHSSRYHLPEAEGLLADLADTEALSELFAEYDRYNRDPKLPAEGKGPP